MVMNFFFYTVLINSTSLPVRIHTRKLQDSWEGERQNSSLPTPFFFITVEYTLQNLPPLAFLSVEF